MNHNFGAVIKTAIQIAGMRQTLWGPNGLEDEAVCRDETDIPEGWSLSYDLDLLIYGETYRYTLHSGAIKFAFKPYIETLTRQKQTP